MTLPKPKPDLGRPRKSKKVHPFRVHYTEANLSKEDIKFLQDSFDKALTIMEERGTAYLNNDENRYALHDKLYLTYTGNNEYVGDELIYTLQDAINYRLAQMSPALASLNGNPMSGR